MPLRSASRRVSRLRRAAVLLAAALAVALPVATAALAAPPEDPAATAAEQQQAFLSGVFGEPTLEEIVGYADFAEVSDVAPWRQFRQAREAEERGDADAAIAALAEVLDRPDASAAAVLWSWANLRRLGVAPPASVADRVRGVVYEVPVEGGIEYLAAYADGRWRILDTAGGGVFWETTDDPTSMELTSFVMTGGQRLLYWTPDPEPRDTSRPEAVRVTLLTFAGPRQILLDREKFASDSPTRNVASGLIEGFAKLMDYATQVAGAARQQP